MFQPLAFSTVPAGTNLDRFQSVYKERAAIPYVDRNVAVTTVAIATNTNFSGNDSFINCWVCSVHPPRRVRSTSMAIWNAFCGYACSSPRRESVPVFFQISITFFCVDRSHSESCTDCILRELKMKMYWNTQSFGFMKSEMFWYLIT